MKINLTAIIITALLCATVIALMLFFERGAPAEMPAMGTTTEPVADDTATLPPATPGAPVPNPGEPILESPQDDDAAMVACTMDAKECPDGSYVGRIGPDCSFAPCPTPGDDEPVACTEEAKICPGGTVVVREGPNCEFAACPTVAEEPVACTQDVKECPDGSYVGREAPDCAFAACPSNENSLEMNLQAI